MAEAIKNPDELKGQLDQFEAKTREQVRDFKDSPEVKEALREFTQKIAELKAEMGDKDGYMRKMQELATTRDLLLTVHNEVAIRTKSLEESARKLELKKKEKQAYFLNIEQRVQVLPPKVQDIPLVKDTIKDLRDFIEAIQIDYSKYDAQKFQEFEKFLKDTIPLVKKEVEGIEKIQKTIDSITPDVLSDPKVLKLVQDLKAELTKLRDKIGHNDFDETKGNEYHLQLENILAIKRVLSDRKKLFLEKQKEVQAKLLPEMINELCGVFGLGKGNKAELEKVLTAMLMEGHSEAKGNGLTMKNIIDFYVKSKSIGVKTASEKNIQKWVTEIKAQDTTDRVKGGKVKGEIPPDMAEAIKTELKGQNTLKMMQVASLRYQKELNNYLNGVDDHSSLTELGFTDDDFNWLWINCKDEAGEDLGLTNQEAKLIFLEGYTTVLSDAIKNLSDPDKKKTGMLDWLSPKDLAGGAKDFIWNHPLWSLFTIFITLGVAKYIRDKSVEAVIGGGTKGVVELGKKGGKLIGRGGEFLLHQIWVNNNQYRHVEGILSDTYKRYVEGNMKLIYARMALNPGDPPIKVGVDEYGPLSYKEGMARISAMKAAIGSAEKEGKLKVVLARAEHQGVKHDGKILLTRYIQDLARSPEGGIKGTFLTPNMWNYEASFARKWGKGLPGRLTLLVGAYFTHGASLLLLPTVRRTVFGNAWRFFGRGREQGYEIDTTGRRRMPFNDENVLDEGVKHVGDMLMNDPELKRLTCSEEERKASIELLNRYVENAPNPDSTHNYSEKEALDLIKMALDGRGPRLSRAELRIYTIQAIYLLKGESGIVPRELVDGFIDRIRTHRFSYDTRYIDYLDGLYERILSHNTTKYGPHELQLLVQDIETFYRGENITVTDMKGQTVPHETLFGPAAAVHRMDIPDADSLVSDAVDWLKKQPASTTREQFAQHINAQLAGRNLPLGYSLFAHFSAEWDGDTLRRGGGAEILPQIEDGRIATREEIKNAIDVLAQKPEYSKTTEIRKFELLSILDQRLNASVRAKISQIQSNSMFESAQNADSGKKALEALLLDKSFRGAVSQEIPGSYTLDTADSAIKIQPAEVNRYIGTRWDKYISGKISEVKTDFTHDPLNEDSDVVELQRRTLAQCDGAQQEDLSKHFRDELMKKAGENDEAKVTRAERETALRLLQSDLVSGLRRDVDKKDLRKFIETQQEAIKGQDAAKAVAKKDAESKAEKAKIATEVEALKKAITADPLDDTVESQFPETFKKCDDVQKGDLLKHFSDALKATASDDTKGKKDRTEAMGLLEKEIVPNLTRTARSELASFISSQREGIRQQEIKAEFNQLKTDITADPLDDKVEKRFSEFIERCSEAQKGELSRHFRDELKTIASRSAQSKKKVRMEAITLLETLVKKNLPGRSEKEELDLFTEEKRADVDRLDGMKEQSVLKRAIDKIKRDITTDPLADDLEKRIPEMLAKCDDVQKVELVRHFRDALKIISSDVADSKSVLRREALELLETQVKPHLPRSERADLDAYISEQRTEKNKKNPLESGDERLKSAEELSKKIGEVLKDIPQGDVATRLDALTGEGSPLTLAQKQVAGNLWDTIQADPDVPMEEKIGVLTHRLLYAHTGGIDADILREHASMRAHPDILLRINEHLERAGVEKIETEINGRVKAHEEVRIRKK